MWWYVHRYTQSLHIGRLIYITGMSAFQRSSYTSKSKLNQVSAFLSMVRVAKLLLFPPFKFDGQSCSPHFASRALMWKWREARGRIMRGPKLWGWSRTGPNWSLLTLFGLELFIVHDHDSITFFRAGCKPRYVFSSELRARIKPEPWQNGSKWMEHRIRWGDLKMVVYEVCLQGE